MVRRSRASVRDRAVDRAVRGVLDVDAGMSEFPYIEYAMPRYVLVDVMNIRTDFVHPPIPVRNFDWSATDDNYEPGDAIGYGRTEAEAVADLIEQLEEARGICGREVNLHGEVLDYEGQST